MVIIPEREIRDSSEKIPPVGLGMGYMGVNWGGSEMAEKLFYSLGFALDVGIKFIDTAENYWNGESESIIGRAIKGKRERVFISTKVSPENLEKKIVASADGSLRRLGVDYIDLYQVHWPNPTVPFEETFTAMTNLLDSGKVRYIGVCNFNAVELGKIEHFFSDKRFISIQNEFNLVERSAEYDLFSFCRDKKVIFIAYSPFYRGLLDGFTDKWNIIQQIAEKYNKKPSQIVLNWILFHPSTIVIPSSINPFHIRGNLESMLFKILQEDKNLIDKIFEYKIDMIDPSDIFIDSFNLRCEKESIEEIETLALHIRENGLLKPLKIHRVKADKSQYRLIEGFFRYRSWIAAFGISKPVPAIVI